MSIYWDLARSGTLAAAHWVAVGEFNADGRPDLAVANSSSNSVSVLMGNGTGAFGPATALLVGLHKYGGSAGLVGLGRQRCFSLVVVTR